MAAKEMHTEIPGPIICFLKAHMIRELGYDHLIASTSTSVREDFFLSTGIYRVLKLEAPWFKYKCSFIGTLWNKVRKFHKNSNLAILLNKLYNFVMRIFFIDGEL